MEEMASLRNTPGIYYAIAYWLSSLVYIHVNPLNSSRIRRTVSSLSGLAFLCIFMTLTHQIDKRFFFPCMMLDILTIFLMLRGGTDMSMTNTFYFTVRAFILGEFAASLEWQLYYYSLTRTGVKPSQEANLLFLTCIYSLVFLFFWFLERQFAEKNRDLSVSGKGLTAVCLIAAAIFIISNISYAMSDTPFSSRFTSEIFIIRTLTDLGGVGILFAFHLMQHEMNSRLEVDYLRHILEMQYQNYLVSEESIDLVNRKYHDLKHQIRLLKSSVTEQERQEYLQQMEQEIRQYEARYKTGCHVLDTILTGKSLQCQRLGITFLCTADGSALDFISVMDICSLFGNILDNAIESVQKIENPDERIIRLSIDRRKNFLRIQEANRYTGPVQMEGGLPVTTKKDRAYHGYGVRSIKNVVEKYGGSLQLVPGEAWFEVHILIPLKEGQIP